MQVKSDQGPPGALVELRTNEGTLRANLSGEASQIVHLTVAANVTGAPAFRWISAGPYAPAVGLSRVDVAFHYGEPTHWPGLALGGAYVDPVTGTATIKVIVEAGFPGTSPPNDLIVQLRYLP